MKRKQSTPLIQIDNSLLFRLRKHPNALKHFLSDIEKCFGKRQFDLIATPFAALEASGVTVPRITLDLDVSTFRGRSNAEIFEICFDEARQKLSQVPALTSPALISAALQQLAFTTELFRGHFQNLVVNRFREASFVAHLHDQLAVDQVFKFSFPNNIQVNFDAAVYASVFRIHELGVNISMYRGISQLWKRFNPVLERNLRSDFEQLRSILSQVQLKHLEDHLDSEIVHFPCVGFLENDRLRKVYAFTCDPMETIVTRCGVYRLLIDSGNRMIASEVSRARESLPIKWPRFSPGLIGFCNDEGRIIQLYRTKKLPRKVFPGFTRQ